MNPQDGTKPQILATSESIAEVPGDNKLIFAEKRVKLSLSKGPIPMGVGIAETPGVVPEKIKVRIQGIRFKEPPVFAYGVFLNLPKGEKTSSEWNRTSLGHSTFLVQHRIT